MAQPIQLRRGTAALATANNAILLSGEIGFETDTGKFKIGNGYTTWNALPYASGGGTGTPGATGATGATGAQGAAGAAGTPTVIAYADSATGTGFTTTFNAAKDYIAFKVTPTPIGSLTAADFTGLWKNYKGAPGNGGNGGATLSTMFYPPVDDLLVLPLDPTLDAIVQVLKTVLKQLGAVPTPPPSVPTNFSATVI